MRSSKSRSRNKSNRQRTTLGNIVNRVFDSSGPEGKVRGTPQQIIDKYLALARDAQLSNDRVAEQAFLQHAEHYTRMLGEAQREMAERQGQQHMPRAYGDEDGIPQNGQNGGQNGNGREGRDRDQRGRDQRERNYPPRDQAGREAPIPDRGEEDQPVLEPAAEQPVVVAEEPAALAQPEVAPVQSQPAAPEASEGLPPAMSGGEAEDSGPVETPEAAAPRPKRAPRTPRAPRSAPADAAAAPAPRTRRKAADKAPAADPAAEG